MHGINVCVWNTYIHTYIFKHVCLNVYIYFCIYKERETHTHTYIHNESTVCIWWPYSEACMRMCIHWYNKSLYQNGRHVEARPCVHQFTNVSHWNDFTIWRNSVHGFLDCTSNYYYFFFNIFLVLSTSPPLSLFRYTIHIQTVTIFLNLFVADSNWTSRNKQRELWLASSQNL